MLKERLYYQDAYVKDFSTKLVRESVDEEGKRYVVLENTAFYPTGGGQPHDSGTLNGVPVTDVLEMDGEIRHYLEGSLGDVAEVAGVIDWGMRFDHMQQHAGQHILTAAFVELLDIPTISFHLGKEIVSIDLDTEELSAEQLSAVERLANQIILENRPIETKWVTEAELEDYTLRKGVVAQGEIRLVIIPDFDYNGCGGTHPRSTAEVGSIKIVSTEKQKRKVRVHFVCGKRVLTQLHQKTAVLTEASRQLSVPEMEVNGAIGKLLDANRSLEKRIGDLEASLLSFEAGELAQKASDGIIQADFIGRSIQELQKLARLIVSERSDLVTLLVAENGDKLQFVAARGEFASMNMKEIAAKVLPIINGKGGGNESFAQGGGERTVSGLELLAEMRKACE